MIEHLGQPSRNFCIFSSLLLTDPHDGKEKLVLANYADGGCGEVILIDLVTNEAESILFPGKGDFGAWALWNWRNEFLVVGTCSQEGYILRLDLRTREWAEPLQDPGEKYIWQWTEGSDGKLYGCTYPGCALLQYDPVSHVLVNLGRASSNERNMYSRTISGGIPGKIVISVGFDQPHLTVWDIASETFTEITHIAELANVPAIAILESNPGYVKLNAGGTEVFLDSRTFEPIGKPVNADRRVTELSPDGRRSYPVHRLESGEFIGVRGQEYFVMKEDGSDVRLFPIRTSAPATRIHALTTDDAGRVWGASALGQTIFRMNPEMVAAIEASFWNSPSVCDGNGEVFGMLFVNGKLYMSSYSGGELVEYDPMQPWNQLEQINPRTVYRVGPRWIRPEAGGVIGPDGAMWVGWAARYGVYGGGISRLEWIDGNAAGNGTTWDSPVEGHKVSGMAADEQHLYFVTMSGGNGVKEKEGEPYYFFVWSPETGEVHRERCEKRFDGGLGAIAALPGSVWLQAGDMLRIFDTERMQFIADLDIGAPCTCLIADAERHRILAFCGDRLVSVCGHTRNAETVCGLPGPIHVAALAPEGHVYFAHNKDLYRLTDLFHSA